MLFIKCVFMKKISVYFSRGLFQVTFAVVAALLLSVTLVQAATTISTNIVTGGNLQVDGNSTIGTASTDNALIVAGFYASSTALFDGAFTTTGNSTFGNATGDNNIFTGGLYASSTAMFDSGITLQNSETITNA